MRFLLVCSIQLSYRSFKRWSHEVYRRENQKMLPRCSVKVTQSQEDSAYALNISKVLVRIEHLV